MRAAVHKYHQVLDKGKRPVLYLHGKAFDYAEVARYWSRKGLSIDDVLDDETKGVTTDAVECIELAPSIITIPESLSTLERTIHTTRQYYQGSFESRTWMTGDEKSLCHSIKDVAGDLNDLDGLHFQCLWASHLFSEGLYQEAGQALIVATAHINDTLLAEDPDTLLCLCSILEHFRTSGRREIAIAVIRQFSALGEVLLGPTHPLRCICECLALVEPAQSGQVVVKCLEAAVDIFEKIVGPFHPTTLRYRRTYITSECAGDASRTASKLQELLSKCEQALGPGDDRTLELHSDLTEYCLNKYDFLETKNIGQHIVSLAEQLQDGASVKLFHANGLSAVTLSQMAFRELASGKTVSRSSIELRLFCPSLFPNVVFETSSARVYRSTTFRGNTHHRRHE